MITPDQLASQSEHSQQVALFAQAALEIKNYPQLHWMFAIPNANSHKMVSEGVRGGVPDICLPYPRWDKMYSGLFIELKTEKRRKEKNGGLSEDQIKYLAYLSEAGYKCCVCYGWKDGWDSIMEYLA